MSRSGLSKAPKERRNDLIIFVVIFDSDKLSLVSLTGNEL